MTEEEQQVRPYGTWKSAITSDLIVSAAVSLGEVWVEDEDDDESPVWWSEMRPQEGGRIQLVRWAADNTTSDMLPAGYAARTRVHEYGGGAWWLHGGSVFFANWDDQRLYRLAPDDDDPVALTRPPMTSHGLRYADGRVTADGRWIICVRESHEADGEAVNELVAIPTGLPLVLGGRPYTTRVRATTQNEWGSAMALGTESDFVSNPRISPDGRWLAWLEWDHPDMPWDATELWVAELAADEHDVELVDPRRVAGARGGEEAIVQPEWSPDGVLHFLSDRQEWWNLYAFARTGRPADGDDGTIVVEVDADIGTPPWVFGMSRYTFVGPKATQLVAAQADDGHDDLTAFEGTTTARWIDATCDPQYTSWSCIKRRGRGIVAIAASFETEPAVVSLTEVDVYDQEWEQPRLLRPPRDLGLDDGWFSVPRHITFPTVGGHEAHGLFYPPTNPNAAGPPDEKPPLLVAIHGGPTSAARSQLQLGIQFWTSRGFGVLDVNYRGSTGYGRDFRRLLVGQWGIADVEDCAAGAAFLADEGLVDGGRLAIHGGSAGGFTTLMALITTDRFAAGTSSYGVTDLEALARDTHKFESRYLDGLVGPYPEAKAVYAERSPIHHLDQLDDPILILQGTEDEIVPLSQAEMMVEALRRNGVPFGYIAFEGEQHGFRQADTIVRALHAELFFYARVLGFEATGGDAGVTDPVTIENL